MAKRRALVVWEVLTAIAVIGGAVALLLVAGDRQRKAMGLGQSIANLRQLGTAHAQYGNDNAGRVATFSWHLTDTGLSQYPDLNFTYSTDQDAASAQAVDIMRRRGGGTQMTMPYIPGWISYAAYSHLAITEYLGQSVVAPWMVSPGDAPRLEWRASGVGPPDGPTSYRYVYGSSYELPPAFWCTDFGSSSGPGTYNQGASHRLYQGVGSITAILGRRRYSDIAYPGSKVMAFEQFQRFFGPRDAFALYPEARVPALMSDGAVVVRRSSEANAGADPSRVTASISMMVTYVPNTTVGEPPGLYSFSGDLLEGHFRWSRYGLRGRDFDGPETKTPP